MKRTVMILLVLCMAFTTACGPASTVVNKEKTITVKLVTGEKKEYVAVNSKGEYLTRVGVEMEDGETKKVTQVNSTSLKQAAYSNAALREILSMMFPSMSDEQYVSDYVFEELTMGQTREDGFAGEILYLNEKQLDRLNQSTLFSPESIFCYADMIDTVKYEVCGYYDIERDYTSGDLYYPLADDVDATGKDVYARLHIGDSIEKVLVTKADGRSLYELFFWGDPEKSIHYLSLYCERKGIEIYCRDLRQKNAIYVHLTPEQLKALKKAYNTVWDREVFSDGWYIYNKDKGYWSEPIMIPFYNEEL